MDAEKMERATAQSNEVYVVNRTQEIDGLYVFKSREDAEAFRDALGGDEFDVVLTAEPLFSSTSQHTADLIESARS